MIGHLLYLLKEIDKKEVHKNLKLNSNKGKKIKILYNLLLEQMKLQTKEKEG